MLFNIVPLILSLYKKVKMQISKILVLALLPILMSWVPSSLHQNTLDVKIEVIQKKGKADLKINILNGEADFGMVVTNNGSYRKEVVFSDSNYLIKEIPKGIYSVAIQDGSRKYFLQRVVVD